MSKLTSDITRSRTVSSGKLDGIQFDNIPINGSLQAYTTSRNGNIWKSATGTWLSGVNAVDIDWNEAQFANAVSEISEVPDAGAVQSDISSITTTGELVSIIAKQQKQIDALITMVKGLYASLVE